MSKPLFIFVSLFFVYQTGFCDDASIFFTDSVLVHRSQLLMQVSENLEQEEEELSATPGTIPQKSVAKAVAFSALVPGTGQIYAKSYIKAGIFMAVEIGAWAANIYYNNKGSEKDDEFRQYADQFWSEKAYWSYVNYQNSKLEEPLTEVYPAEWYDTPEGGRWYLILDQVYGPDAVANLREIENRFPGFTHRLPETKTQQYYEMIGKYAIQFGNAWSDASFDFVYDGYRKKVSPQNDFYSQMRAESNEYYDKAGYGAMVALVNHVVSAFDAGFTTRSFNRRQLRMSYQNRPVNGQYVNLFGLSMRW